MCKQEPLLHLFTKVTTNFIHNFIIYMEHIQFEHLFTSSKHKNTHNPTSNVCFLLEHKCQKC